MNKLKNLDQKLLQLRMKEINNKKKYKNLKIQIKGYKRNKEKI